MCERDDLARWAKTGFSRRGFGATALAGAAMACAPVATDQLDPAIAPENRSFLTGKGNGGFGFNVFVRTGPPPTPDEARGSVGELYWDGFPSMLFWVDPLQDMAVVFATQKVDFDGSLHRDIRAATYGTDYPGR